MSGGAPVEAPATAVCFTRRPGQIIQIGRPLPADDRLARCHRAGDPRTGDRPVVPALCRPQPGQSDHRHHRSPRELFNRVCRILSSLAVSPWRGSARLIRTPRWVVPIAQFGDDGGYLDRLVIDAGPPAGRTGLTGMAIREERIICNDFVHDPITHLGVSRRPRPATGPWPSFHPPAKPVAGAITVFSKEPGFFPGPAKSTC